MTATVKTAPVVEDPEALLSEWVGRVTDLETRHAAAVVAAEDAGTLVQQARRASVMGLNADVRGAIEAERTAIADRDEIAAQLEIAKTERNSANQAAGRAVAERQAEQIRTDAARIVASATDSDEAIDGVVAQLLDLYAERWALVQEATALADAAHRAGMHPYLGLQDVPLRVERIAHLDPNKYPRQSPYELGM